MGCAGKMKMPVTYTRKGKTYTRMQMKCPPRTTPKRSYTRYKKKGEWGSATKAERQRYYRQARKSLMAQMAPVPLMIPSA